jgi:hypothetical protein
VHRSIFLQPSPELSAFMSVSSGELLVRGRKAAAVSLSGAPSSPVALFEHSCPSEPTTYFVALRVTPANGTAVTTAEIPIEFVCPTSPPAPCGGEPDATDAGAGEATPPADPGNDTVRAGCVVSGHTATGFELTFAALALAFAARRRKP